MEQEERDSLAGFGVPDVDAIGLDVVFRDGDRKARRCHDVSPGALLGLRCACVCIAGHYRQRAPPSHLRALRARRRSARAPLAPRLPRAFTTTQADGLQVGGMLATSRPLTPFPLRRAIPHHLLA